MEKVDTLVVDKTGTLTEGRPKVVAIVAAAGFQDSEILRLAASVERASEHPLADAIVRAAKERNLDLAKVDAGKLDLNLEDDVDPCAVVNSCIALMKERAHTGRLRLSDVTHTISAL